METGAKVGITGTYVECNGHWVDIDNSFGTPHDSIHLVFADPEGKTYRIPISVKDAKELRKELKAAITLVEIAEDF